MAPHDGAPDLKIAVAADHAGFELKQTLVRDLRAWGHEALDLGTHDPSQPDDYPDFAELVALAIRRGEAERGIIVCGSGVGVCVAANKFPGVRAGGCHDSYSAHQGVEHDDMNVLCLGARIIGSELAREVVRKFVDAKFSGEARHIRRLEKVIRIEERFSKGDEG
jgi:ribose 5-phosphate isomerase B